MANILANTTTGAATGATLGSVIPGVGTLAGGAIGGAIGLVSSLFGGNKAEKERKRMEQYFDQQLTDNQNWYNNNALGDYTQRADVQGLLGNLRNNLALQNRIIDNTAVVMGQTPEQQAALKEQSSRTMADTYDHINQYGQQYKDSVTNQYLNRKDTINNQRLGWANQQIVMDQNNQVAEQSMINSSLGTLTSLLKKQPGS